MRRALVRLIRDPALRSRMSRAAAAHAQRYDLREAARGTFGCYRRILDELAPPPPLLDEELVA
jgi:hypothetical protein